jgi:hypothetical protein
MRLLDPGPLGDERAVGPRIREIHLPGLHERLHGLRRCEFAAFGWDGDDADTRCVSASMIAGPLAASSIRILWEFGYARRSASTCRQLSLTKIIEWDNDLPMLAVLIEEAAKADRVRETVREARHAHAG